MFSCNGARRFQTRSLIWIGEVISDKLKMSNIIAEDIFSSHKAHLTNVIYPAKSRLS